MKAGRNIWWIIVQQNKAEGTLIRSLMNWKVIAIMIRAVLTLFLCTLSLAACTATPAATITPTAVVVTATTPPNATATPAAARKGGAADHVLGTDSAYVTIVMYG